MATAGDGTAPNETAGAGGKFRKKPSRRSNPATPYDRPLKNNNPSMLKKLVYAGAHRLFHVFRNRLPPLSLQKPPQGIIGEPQNTRQEERRSDSSAKIAAATGISEIEQMSEIQRLTSLLHSRTTESPSGDSLEKHRDVRDSFHAAISTPIVTSKVLNEIASPADLAKSYMVSRGPTNQAHIQDSKLIPRTPITALTQKAANSLRDLENGFLTPRSRGRSAMYTMARTPYTRRPTFSEKGIRSDYDHGAASTSSRSALSHEGKTALKRSSSVQDDVIGSGGPLRRIRQKAIVSSQRDKKELGYTVSQQDGSSQNLLSPNETEPKVSGYASVPAKSTQTANKILQHLETPSPQGKNGKIGVSSYAGTREKSPNKLTLDMLHGEALRSLEKVDAPKFLSRPSDIQKQDSHHHARLHEQASERKDKTEEIGSRKFPVPNNMLTLVNGDSTNSLKDKVPIVGLADLPSKVQEEPPQKKRAFQMSLPESSVQIDDQIHNNGHVPFPLVNNNKPKTSVTDIIKPPAVAEDSKAQTLVETNNPRLDDVSKVSEQAEVKETENATSFLNTDVGLFGGSVREQGLGFKIPTPISSPSNTTTQLSVLPQSTLQTEKIAPEKDSSSFSVVKTAEDAIPFPISANKPLELKPNSSSDPVSVNGNGNDQKSTNIIGRSDSSFPAVPTSASFLFDTATKNLSVPNMIPASNPATFSSLAPFPAPASTSAAISTATASISANITASTASVTISTATTTAAAIFSTVPPPVFSFGSGSATAPTTSMAETGNTSNISPFVITSFATTTTSTTGSGLFSFSSPAATLTSTSQSQGSFFNITNGSQTNTQASSSGILFDSSVPAFASSPSFSIGSLGPSSETKSGNSTSGPTTRIFGSTCQQPPKSSGFSSTFSSPLSSVFTFGASSSTTTPSFVSPSVFRNSTPVFEAAATSPNNNNSNDHISMEDSMVEDSMQTNSPVSQFGQASVGAPGLMFSSATPIPAPTPTPIPAVVPFHFDVQSNQAPPSQNPFQSSSLEFNANDGSFSLGSGGEKSKRRIVRVVRSKNRKK